MIPNINLFHHKILKQIKFFKSFVVCKYKLGSLLNESLFWYHVIGNVIENLKIGMDKFVVELDFFFSQLVIITIDFIDQLSVEIDEPFESLPYQASHTLVNLVLFLLLNEFLSFIKIRVDHLRCLGSHSQIRVNWHIRIYLQDGVSFLAWHATVFASTYFFYVRAFPRLLFLHFFDDIFLINQNKTVQTKLLFTGGSEVIFMTLVDDFVSELAHVTNADLNKGDGGIFVKWKLSHFFRDLLLEMVGLLLLVRLIYWGILLCHLLELIWGNYLKWRHLYDKLNYSKSNIIINQSN